MSLLKQWGKLDRIVCTLSNHLKANLSEVDGTHCKSWFEVLGIIIFKISLFNGVIKIFDYLQEIISQSFKGGVPCR